MAIKTGRTMYLSLGGTAVLKLTDMTVSGGVQEITAAVTNETAGFFPESAVTGLSITKTGNAVTGDGAVVDALWTKYLAAVEVAYVEKRETGAGLTQWAGNCVITGVTENIAAAGENRFTVSVKLSGAPAVTPQIVLAGASTAADGTVFLTPTAQSAAYSGSNFVATGGAAPYTYTDCGPSGSGASEPASGLTMTSGGVVGGTIDAGETDGYHYWFLKVTDNNAVVAVFRVGIQIT